MKFDNIQVVTYYTSPYRIGRKVYEFCMVDFKNSINQARILRFCRHVTQGIIIKNILDEGNFV